MELIRSLGIFEILPTPCVRQ